MPETRRTHGHAATGKFAKHYNRGPKAMAI